MEALEQCRVAPSYCNDCFPLLSPSEYRAAVTTAYPDFDGAGGNSMSFLNYIRLIFLHIK